MTPVWSGPAFRAAHSACLSCSLRSMVRQTSGKSWAAGQRCNRAPFVMFTGPGVPQARVLEGTEGKRDEQDKKWNKFPVLLFNRQPPPDSIPSPNSELKSNSSIADILSTLCSGFLPFFSAFALSDFHLWLFIALMSMMALIVIAERVNYYILQWSDDIITLNYTWTNRWWWS